MKIRIVEIRNGLWETRYQIQYFKPILSDWCVYEYFEMGIKFTSFTTLEDARKVFDILVKDEKRNEILSQKVIETYP